MGLNDEVLLLSHLATLSYDHIAHWSTFLFDASVLDFPHDIHAVKNLAEDDMFAVQERCWHLEFTLSHS